jgi:hypothetical protein
VRHLSFRIFFRVFADRDLCVCGASLHGHRRLGCLGQMDCNAMRGSRQSRMDGFGPEPTLASLHGGPACLAEAVLCRSEW